MIVGAGFAGLIAAHVMPGHMIVESAPGPAELHKALMRFRSKVVSDITGIPFRAVTVRKGIWMDGDWHSPNISIANMYARKVVGKLVDRSIWNLEAATRYIAPADFYQRLIDSVGHRISWGTRLDLSAPYGEPIVSTVPMPVAAGKLADGLTFERAKIHVARYRVPGADVHQTVYYPTLANSLYRASITGDLLICEFIDKPSGHWWGDVQRSFSLGIVEPESEVDQEYGKIAPIDEQARRGIILRLTNEHNIYSLGRFATWRNILLDDVAEDAVTVKKLITNGAYERKLHQQGA